MKKLFSTTCSDNSFSFAMLVLRLGAGLLIMIHYGFDKLLHFARYASKFPDPFHIGSTTTLSLVVFAEFFCGAFIVLGLFTRLATIPLIIAMSVALISAHKGDFFGVGLNAGLFLACFITILFAGAGKISLDRFLI
ncbi:MAG TPA: DoxX family protein [Flavisolibacter sp.]|nr:DoxX family protein [Flavisolibacter sp.]